MGTISPWSPEDRERRKREITEISNRDGIGIAIRTAFGGLPYIGSAITELVNVWIPNSSFERLVDFSLDIGEAMATLQPRINPEYLRTEGGAFVLRSILDGVATTYQKEKLEAFRAFFLNSMLSENTNQEKKEILLRIVNDLTYSHIKVLKLLDSPARFVADRGIAYPAPYPPIPGSAMQILGTCLPELDEAIISVLWGDISSLGLVTGEPNSLRGLGSSTALDQLFNRLTPFGRDFVKFIKMP